MAKRDNKTRQQTKPTLMGRTRSALTRLALTLAVITVAGLAVQIGAAELTRRADAAPKPDAAPIIPVSARLVEKETGYEIRRAFVGQVEPQKTIAVSFELPGRLDDIRVNEGDTVAKGQVLAAQDTSLLETEKARLASSRDATAAQLRFAKQTVQRSRELTERGFTSQAGLDEALARQDELAARIAEITAGMRDVEIRIKKSEITAPIDGRVTDRQVDGGETLGSGQSILELVTLQAPQVRIGVPLELTEERLRDAQIELGGTVWPATLVTLRPDIDPVTRTRTAVFDVDGVITPAFGQTARLILTEAVATPGVWVPTTALKEGVRGQWTVLTADAESTVRPAIVEILHAETDRVFVRGAFPDGTYLIDDGPQRVTVGQKVAVEIGEG